MHTHGLSVRLVKVQLTTNGQRECIDVKCILQIDSEEIIEK